MDAASILELEPIIYNEFVIDTKSFEAFHQDQRLQLTLTEFKILYVLLSRPGMVCTREQLLDQINGDIHLLDRNIDVHISSLRKKIFNGKSIIQTIRGLGYRLSRDEFRTI